MSRTLLIGVDANEANLTKDRVGINRYAFELLHALHKGGRNHKWMIYLSRPRLPDLPPKAGHWQYRVIPPPKFWTQWRLPLELCWGHPRLNVFLSLTHYAPRFSPTSTVVTIMDLGFLRFPDQFTEKDLWQLRIWTDYSIKKATKILTISRASRRDIIGFYHQPPEKIVVVYPGYDSLRFRRILDKDRINTRIKRYQIRQPYILFLGVLRPNKNIERLLEAFALLQTARGFRDMRLVIAGKKGWMYNGSFALAKELRLGEKLVFAGFVAENDVPFLLNGANCFVFPSYWEGFGIPVLEAMACGTPVVVGNAGGLPEVVGEAGILVDPYDIGDIARGIRQAIVNGERLSVKGLKQANKFSWKESAQVVISTLALAAK